MSAENKAMHKIVDENFEDQLEKARTLIRVRSVLDEKKSSKTEPFGAGVSEALELFLKTAGDLGFSVKNVDGFAGYAEIGERGDMIGILAHLDVVPEGDEAGWKHKPYSADVEDGFLHGRGAIDDKGPLVAALYAMKALRDSGASLKRRFRLIAGLDEETSSRCIEYYKTKEEIPSFSFSPDAEFPVVNAEKGILRAELSKTVSCDCCGGHAEIIYIRGGDRFNVVPDCAELLLRCQEAQKETIKSLCEGLEVEETDDGLEISARGKAAHAMDPSKGDNAVQKLLERIINLDLTECDLELIRAVFEIAGRGFSGEGMDLAMSDEISGALTCNLAAIEMEAVQGGAAKQIKIKLDIRYPVTTSPDTVEEKIEIAARAKGFSVCVKQNKAPLHVPESNKAVQILLDAYETITGSRPAPISIGGGTYCRFMPNAVSAGPLFPGEEMLAHRANERVSAEQLLKSTHIYAEALFRFNEAE